MTAAMTTSPATATPTIVPVLRSALALVLGFAPVLVLALTLMFVLVLVLKLAPVLVLALTFAVRRSVGDIDAADELEVWYEVVRLRA